MNCIGCKYYDDSVDCCNADEHCYTEGFENGFDSALNKFSNWLIKYKVIPDGAMQELVRDFKGEMEDKYE